MLLAVKVTSAFDTLTRPERVKVLILDDTVVKRNRSKSVELLARVYDHVEHKFQKGFTLLTLGWSDCITLLQLLYHPDRTNSCFQNLSEHRLRCKPCIHKDIVSLYTGSEGIAYELYGRVCFVHHAFFTKLIPVRNKKSECLYILSTDVTLNDAEIVRIYGNRWSIECFFKASK